MQETPITFPSGDITMAGSLVIPEGEAPYATALLIAGSGPLDRDANHKKMALNLSRDLAQVFADAGWASLRFDKRGIGESGGDYMSTGLFEELADVVAAYDWLVEQPQIRPIVAVGHSVGSIMAAELAGKRPDLAGVVLLSTTTKTGEETLRWQTEQMADHIVPPYVNAALRMFRTSVAKQQAKAVAKTKATTSDVARIQMVKTNAKWMREFIAYDPVPALERIEVPVLAVTGRKDVQVDAADLATVAEVVPTAEVVAVDDVDHLLRHEPSLISNPRFYKKQFAKPIDPRVVDALTGWLNPFLRG
jgi:pimeloyl-ACP methyl ester carboxylesterase